MKKFVLALGIALSLSLSCFAASPESDFRYDLLSDSRVKKLSSIKAFSDRVKAGEDYIIIYDYDGKDEVVEIPSEIEGCKVVCLGNIRVDGYGGTEYDPIGFGVEVKKVIIPETVACAVISSRWGNENIELELHGKGLIALSTGDFKIEKLPADRKIVFVDDMKMSDDVKSFTWPKNWLVYNFNFGEGFYNHKHSRYLQYRLRAKNLEEFALEDGTTDFPCISMYGVYSNLSNLKKIVLPKSLNNMEQAYIYLGKDGSIDFPAGAKIKFGKSTVWKNLSISMKKTLKELGCPEFYGYD